jgi:hypothetical protein
VESILTAEVKGFTVLIGDQFNESTIQKNIGTRNSSFVGGRFFAMSSLASGGNSTVFLNPCGEERDEETGICHKVYHFRPCGDFCGCCVQTVVKLRYVPARWPTDTLLIQNYAALKFIIEGLVAREKADYAGYQSLRNAGFALLDTEIRHKIGGAQARPRMGRWMGQRSNQGMR